jgi:hypothetical protein
MNIYIRENLSLENKTSIINANACVLQVMSLNETSIHY